ncbi:alpha/beta-hydrolase [Coprinellus micaceus]|uniref:Alpha/beta-hydrolase n=1 Tax=Coprinellus micaceus TaxID=71717 RepID=A0A4Y7T159_COPMI|nr:alpha/beta-hydrolase [Coprinellus micaceus]
MSPPDIARPPDPPTLKGPHRPSKQETRKQPVKEPFILLRGWAANLSDPDDHVWGNDEAYLSSKGIDFFVPHYHRFGSIDERMRSAITQIGEKYHGVRVHLVGHSLGGLVARAIAARRDLTFTVLTVTTFGSPHRGIEYLHRLPKMDGNGWLGAILRKVFKSDCGGLSNVTPQFMEEFNEATPNNPDVRYFSWAGQLGSDQIKYIPVLAVINQFHPHNDGVVGVESAMWGTHLGTVPGLSHSRIVSVDLLKQTIPHLRKAERRYWRVRLRAGCRTFFGRLANGLGRSCNACHDTIMDP